MTKQRAPYLILFLLFILLFSLPTQAARTKTKHQKTNVQQKSRKEKAIKNYKTLMKHAKQKSKTVQYAYAYVDNDSVPELFLYTATPRRIACNNKKTDWWTEKTIRLYTYKKCKTRLIQEFPYSQDTFGNKKTRYGYYKNTGVFTESFYSADAGCRIRYFYSMARKKRKESGTRDLACLFSDKEKYYTVFTKSMKSKTVTEKEYKAFLKKYTKNKKSKTLVFKKF